MSSFTRYAAVAVVVLSIGLLAAALPALRVDEISISIPAITGTDACSLVFAEVAIKLEAALKALLGCQTPDELTVQLNVLVALLQGCVDELLKVGAGVSIEAQAKADIIACVAAIITLCVQVFAKLSVVFGLEVVVKLCVSLDAVLRLLLVTLDVCINGILVLIAELIVKVDIGLFAQLGLTGCLNVLHLAL